MVTWWFWVFFVKANAQNVAGCSITGWEQDTKAHYGTKALNVLHGFLDFCPAFFAKILWAVKYVACSFLGNTSESQGESLTAAFYCFLQRGKK